MNLSNDQAYRSKTKELDLIQGVGREQFTHLKRYVDELIKSNPYSIIKIQYVDSSDGLIFERIYVCLKACKVAFATTCIPLIGLDACFSKMDFGGKLINDVSKDGNNKMMLIAYAVVEAKTKDS